MLFAPAAIDIVFGEADPPLNESAGLMELNTARLILRAFREEDVDAMAQLFANPDFMRFSLGAFTERKKTVDFIEKVMG
jgi:RimJ/RimL family protein N-acetyltransferase